MSQRTGSVAYLTFSAGLSLAVYIVFVGICDRWGWQSSLFRIFGQNALAAYILHPMVASASKPYMPNDAPAWYVAGGFAVYFALCVLIMRYLEKHELFLRL
jgi:peptidoglycan/LPS O-acetylase OafA/YrhL